MKGDHLVGKYYVEYDKHYKDEVRKLEAEGITKEQAEKQAPLMIEVQQIWFSLFYQRHQVCG